MYLKSGGETEWFTEEKFPPKFRVIGRLNRIMARAPWEIKAEIIEDILENEQVHWSSSELAFYVQIIAFAHQNSIIALSTGLLP